MVDSPCKRQSYAPSPIGVQSPGYVSGWFGASRLELMNPKLTAETARESVLRPGRGPTLRRGKHLWDVRFRIEAYPRPCPVCLGSGVIVIGFFALQKACCECKQNQ